MLPSCPSYGVPQDIPEHGRRAMTTSGAMPSAAAQLATAESRKKQGIPVGPESLAAHCEEVDGGSSRRKLDQDVIDAMREHTPGSSRSTTPVELEGQGKGRSEVKTDIELAYLRWQSSMKLRTAWEAIFERVSKEQRQSQTNDGQAQIDRDGLFADLRDALDADRGAAQPSAEMLLQLMTDWQPRKRIVPPITSSVGPLDDNTGKVVQPHELFAADEDEESEDIIDFSRPDWEDDVRGKKRLKLMEPIEDTFTSLAEAVPFDSDDSEGWTDADEHDARKDAVTPHKHAPKGPAIAQLMSLLSRGQERGDSDKENGDDADRDTDTGKHDRLEQRRAGREASSPTQKLATPRYHMSKEAVQGSQLKPLPRVHSKVKGTRPSSPTHIAATPSRRPQRDSAEDEKLAETPRPRKSGKKQHQQQEVFSSPSMATMCGGSGQCTKSFCMMCGAIGRSSRHPRDTHKTM